MGLDARAVEDAAGRGDPVKLFRRLAHLTFAKLVNQGGVSK